MTVILGFHSSLTKTHVSTLKERCPFLVSICPFLYHISIFHRLAIHPTLPSTFFAPYVSPCCAKSSRTPFEEGRSLSRVDRELQSFPQLFDHLK